MQTTEIKRNLIDRYFRLGLTQNEIVGLLAFRHNIVLSTRHLRRILKACNLMRRKNFSPLIDVIEFIEEELAKSGQLNGYRWMYLKCIHAGFVVRKEDVRFLLGILDPVGVDIRSRRRLRRRKYYAKGPDFLWHVDSYDKLKPFGICINGCIDGFSRKMIWLEANTTSSDPKVVGGYFIKAVQTVEGCPQIMRADMGTENGHIAAMQCFLMRNDDNRSHFIYGRSTANQRIEAWWCMLRRQAAQFWINIFHELKDDGYFSGNELDKMLIQFCFMTLIQDELNEVFRLWNYHIIRPVRGSCMPSGRPVTMYSLPEIFNTHSYLQQVTSEEIDICKEECIFKSDFLCDEDMFNLCTIYMEENGWGIPNDVVTAIELYKMLRLSVMNDL